MDPFTIGITVLTMLPKLMAFAEQVGGPGSGPQKKEMVKAGVHAAIGVTAGLSRGGQKETMKQLDALPIDDMIDNLAELFSAPRRP